MIVDVFQSVVAFMCESPYMRYTTVSNQSYSFSHPIQLSYAFAYIVNSERMPVFPYLL